MPRQTNPQALIYCFALPLHTYPYMLLSCDLAAEGLLPFIYYARVRIAVCLRFVQSRQMHRSLAHEINNPPLVHLQ